jgi:hypothetical protein
MFLLKLIEQNRNYAKAGIKSGIAPTAIILNDQRLVWPNEKSRRFHPFARGQKKE